MERCFTPRTCASGIRKFSKTYRAALMAIGKSPDVHIYDLNDRSLEFVKESSERNFITKVMYFYGTLGDDITKKIFVTEILEPGRHYSFWHFGVMETPTYKGKILEIYRKVNDMFQLEAYR